MRYRLVLKDEDIDLSKIDLSNYTECKNLAYKTKDPKVLRYLANSKIDAVRFSVASNENCPADVLEKLANDKYWGTHQAVARNKNTPVNILIELVDDPHSAGLSIINENFPIQELRKLFKKNTYHYDYDIVMNPNCPSDILEKVAERNKRDWSLISRITYNNNCSVNLLRQLAEDENHWVREGVLKNPNTPEDVLKKLAQDENKDVRKLSREKLKAKGIKFNSPKKPEINSNNLEFKIIDAEGDGWGPTGGPGFTGVINLEVNLNGTTGTISIEGYDDNFEEYEETAQEYEDNTDNPDEAQELLASLSNQNMKWKTSNEEIKESVKEFLEEENIELPEEAINTIVKAIKQNINKYIKQLFPVNKRILNKAEKLWERIYG